MIKLQTEPQAIIQCLAFSPDGSSLAVCGSHLTGVRVFDMIDAHERVSFRGHVGDVKALAFAPEGGAVASADSAGQIKLWNTETGIEQSAFHAWPRGIHCLAFSPNGKMLAGGSDSWVSAAQVRRWDVATGRELSSFRGHGRPITCLTFSPDGLTLATGSRDRSIRLWDANSGRERAGFAARMTDFLRHLVLGGSSDEQKDMLSYATHIRALAFAPDGQWIAAATGFRATVWKIDGQLITTLKSHRALVNAIAFSPDGRTLATASRDGTVKFWDTADFSEKPRRQTTRPQSTFEWGLGRVHTIAFSPDGTRAAAGGDEGLVVVWDTDDC